jgi:AcrR family transcriptional regulator
MKPPPGTRRAGTMSAKSITSFTVLGKQYSLPYLSGHTRVKERILMKATLLFCLKGYDGLTMRDIAAEIGITAGALYNHYKSKGTLWDAVLDHSLALFLLYHKSLDEALQQAAGFEEIVDILLTEPAKMRNTFTCYAFSLICAEQFRSKRAGKIFRETFLDYSIDFNKRWFDKCVERGQAAPFDTALAARLLVYCVWPSVFLSVHAHLENRDIGGDITGHFAAFRALLMQKAGF